MIQYLILTLLGFLMAQLADILSRDKDSESSPRKFNLIFFLKDTWLKIIVSLLLSLTIGAILYLTLIVDDTKPKELFGFQFNYLLWLYVAIGAVPEWILQKLKKYFGILQPKDNIQGFDRK